MNHLSIKRVLEVSHWSFGGRRPRNRKPKDLETLHVPTYFATTVYHNSRNALLVAGRFPLGVGACSSPRSCLSVRRAVAAYHPEDIRKYLTVFGKAETLLVLGPTGFFVSSLRVCSTQVSHGKATVPLSKVPPLLSGSDLVLMKPFVPKHSP